MNVATDFYRGATRIARRGDECHTAVLTESGFQYKMEVSTNLTVWLNSVLETLEASVSQGAFILRMNHLLSDPAYVLQRSSDLTTWQAVSSFATGAGTNQWSSTLGNESAAYFRLKWEP